MILLPVFSQNLSWSLGCRSRGRRNSSMEGLNLLWFLLLLFYVTWQIRHYFHIVKRDPWILTVIKRCPDVKYPIDSIHFSIKLNRRHMLQRKESKIYILNFNIKSILNANNSLNLKLNIECTNNLIKPQRTLNQCGK